jgi:hypothetical protein
MGLGERDEMRLKSVIFELDSLRGVGKVLRGRIELFRLLEGELDQSYEYKNVCKFFVMADH